MQYVKLLSFKTSDKPLRRHIQKPLSEEQPTNYDIAPQFRLLRFFIERNCSQSTL